MKREGRARALHCAVIVIMLWMAAAGLSLLVWFGQAVIR